jgi:hypothetical protein
VLRLLEEIQKFFLCISSTMKRFAILIVNVLFLTSLLGAADDLKTAKVVAVKAYDRGRIAFWEGRVPIYDGYPFYDITLAVDIDQKKDEKKDQKKYVVRYESMTGYYPSTWKVGRDIRVRLEGKGKIILFNGEEEVLASIYNGHLQDCVPSTGRPNATGAGPQVPCD